MHSFVEDHVLEPPRGAAHTTRHRTVLHAIVSSPKVPVWARIYTLFCRQELEVVIVMFVRAVGRWCLMEARWRRRSGLITETIS